MAQVMEIQRKSLGITEIPRLFLWLRRQDLNLQPVAVPDDSAHPSLTCRPLPLLFPRFICHRQRSKTSPSGYEHEKIRWSSLCERTKAAIRLDFSPTICRRIFREVSSQSLPLLFPHRENHKGFGKIPGQRENLSEK